jgi:hypothetical protein
VASALIVSMQRRGPGQMLGLPDGMGDPSVLDTLTGGEYSRLSAQLDRLELALKVSIFASCIAGVAGLAIIFRSHR